MKTKLLFLLLLANFTIYAQTNLVQNGGFDDWGGSSLPANWTVTNSVFYESESSLSQYSARLMYTTVSPKITAQVPMKAGVTYTIKYKYRYVSSNYSGDHPISLNISKTGSSATLSSSTFAKDNLWTEKETTFTADQDLSYDLSFSTFSFDSQKFDVLIDAVQVYIQGTEQNTLIPDVNFENRLIALRLDSGTADGKVPTINISSLKYLNLNRFSISDLTGIQDFKSLLGLDCSNNTLKTLDITKNTNLVKLDCSGNSLQTLDLSKNTNLNLLDVTSNLFATLDVTSNTLLEYLHCGNNGSNSNKIKNLDLSKNTKLLHLSMNKSEITNLDVTKNPALKVLHVSANNLTSLDVSQNTELESLMCDGNKLTTLDLSKNKSLIAVQCANNQLTTLNVSNNKSLIYASCYINNLASLNLKNGNNSKFVQTYSFPLKYYSGDLTGGGSTASFKNNINLSCIQVDNVDYSKTNWSAFKEDDIYFSALDCSLSSYIPDAAFEDKLIALGIDNDGKNGAVLNSSIATVTTLDLSNSSIKDLTGIQGFSGLLKLNVSGNDLQKMDLSKNPLLNTLNASNNPNLTCIQVANLAATSSWTVTKDASASFSLDCNVYTLIPDPQFEDYLISKGIDRDGKNGKVKTENIVKVVNMNDLTNKNISDLTGIEDFTALEQMIVSSNKLTKLDLSKNLALNYLDVGNNQLSTINVSKNIALWGLNCSNNAISDINLKSNINLINLQVSTNKLTSIDVSSNTKLGYFLIDRNKLTSLDVSKNPELYQLWCSENQIRTLDLSKNPKITQVIATSNKLVNLNFKNGTNNLINVTNSNNGGIRFNQNPDLTCIQVDDAAYSNANWSAKKDATAVFSTVACPVVVPYTLIPDAKFEDKLIALGIDKDGKNGKVETMNIVALTSLNVANSEITDLKGIEDFSSLTSLEANNNLLKTIDVSKNTSLTKLNVSKNQLTTLNVALNTNLSNLNFNANTITVIDLSKNIVLSNLNCNNNALETLDVSKNTKLTFLSASFNKIQSLDVSKNTILKEFDCASNNMYNLNVKNGNNANMQNMFFGNFTENPNLLCIQVDDAAFSTNNWIAKDLTASYSTDACVPNYPYTLIPDPNFEKILISQGIDKDGVNGKVLTSSISKITQLSVYDSTNKVSDLTGIEDFTALESLSCSNGSITKLDVSKNQNLKSLFCSNNLLTSIDVSKNLNLVNLDVSYNNLTAIDVTKNTRLDYLRLTSNQIASVDISQNTSLTSLAVKVNKLTSLDVSKNTALTSIEASNNQITNLNVSKNIALTLLAVSNGALTSLDVSNNKALKSIDVSFNKIELFDVSQNPLLTSLLVNSNQLTSLNIKNGKNTLLTSSYIAINSNPKLYCILVDDVTYANANWSGRKDSFATYNTECTGEIVLPFNNFVIETKGESCLGENNGEISITAKQAFAYSASINGKTTAFTNNALKVTALTPGVYAITITIPGQIFEQNFNVTIAKGATITGKSSITSRKVDVEITEGTAPFTVFVDGQAQFETIDSNFSLDLDKAALVEVATAKACEGVYSKKISTMDVFGSLTAYPNPTTGSFEIEIPVSKNEVKIEIYNFGGQLVSTKNYTIENGKAQLNLENNPSGIYAAKIYLDTPEYIKIIKK